MRGILADNDLGRNSNFEIFWGTRAQNLNVTLSQDIDCQTETMLTSLLNCLGLDSVPNGQSYRTFELGLFFLLCVQGRFFQRLASHIESLETSIEK